MEIFDWKNSKFKVFKRKVDNVCQTAFDENNFGFLTKSKLIHGIGMLDFVHWRRDISKPTVIDSELKMFYLLKKISEFEQILINCLLNDDLPRIHAISIEKIFSQQFGLVYANEMLTTQASDKEDFTGTYQVIIGKKTGKLDD